MERLLLRGVRVILLFLIAGAVLNGCGGGSSIGPVINVKLSPATVSLSRGATAQITAQALDINNNTAGVPALTYGSSNDAIITVSSSGLICAGRWDAQFINCQTTDSNNNLLPLATVASPVQISASFTIDGQTKFSSAVVVTDHERIDSVRIIPDPGNPVPGPGNATGCVSQGSTPPANTAKFTAQAFSNDPASCQRITGSPAVPCQVPGNTIGSIDWSISPEQIANIDATPKVASDPVVMTAAVPGQGTVSGSIGAVGSLVSGSATFTTCAVANIHVQKSETDTSTSFTAPVSSTVTLTPIVVDSIGNSLDLTTSTLGLTWLSSQPALAAVSLGTVNTGAPGTAEISAACLPSSCNINLNQPVYSDDVVTATITGTVDSSVLVTTATPPACTANVTCTNSTYVVAIDTQTNVAGTALSLAGGAQVNSMVLAPAGSSAFLGTICANGTIGPDFEACSGLLSFNPISTAVATPSPTITGSALTTDGNTVVSADPTTNQIFIVSSGLSIEAIPAISISSLIASTGASESGNTVTLSTTTPHGLTAGQPVLVGNVAVAGYNGVYTVASVPSPTSLTYTDPNTGLAASGGGYVTPGTSAAISPDGSKIYIAVGNNLYIYQSGLPLRVRPLSGFINPGSSQAAAFFATGPMGYVADSGGDDVAASCSDSLFGTVPVVTPSGFPTHIAAVPNATAMVDASGGSSSIDEIDVTPILPNPYGVCPPNITNSHTSASFGTSFTAKQLIVTPDSKLALILSDKGVLVYNLTTKQTTVVPLSGGAQALSGGVTPDGAQLYVGTTDSTVHRIDLTTLTDAQSIAVNPCPSVQGGCNPDFVVVRPVAVAAVLTALAVTPKNPKIGVGTTEQFTATGTFSDKTTRDMTNFVSWATSNPTVAIIGPLTDVTPPLLTPGLARALATGTAAITASTGGLSASTTLTVQ